MSVAIVIVSVILSALIGYIVGTKATSAKAIISPSELEELKNRLLITGERLAASELLATKLGDSNKDLQSRNEVLLSNLSALDNDLKNKAKRSDELIAENNKLSTALTAKDEAIVKLKSENAALAASLEANAKSGVEKEAYLKEFLEKSKDELKAVAVKSLQENSQTFLQKSAGDLGVLLNPLKEDIEAFKKTIGDKSVRDAEQFGSIKTELEKMFQASNRLSTEANALTEALKGDSKTQGDWGEAVLARMLEDSGLREGEDFVTQESVRDDDGKLHRPDVIVRMPGKRSAIIDSKVSLTAYAEYCRETDPARREVLLAEHIKSVERHISQLGDKDYPKLYPGESPDFVFLFIPIEPAFLALGTYGDQIQQKAQKKKVMICTTSTLFTALKLFAEIWRNERRHQNFEKIIGEAKGIYEKIVGFIEDFQKIGNELDQAKRVYDDAFLKLKDGKGSVLKRVEKFKELGVSPIKAIPQELLE